MRLVVTIPTGGIQTQIRKGTWSQTITPNPLDTSPAHPRLAWLRSFSGIQAPAPKLPALGSELPPVRL